MGWDPTPAVVSVWADRTDRALVWQRSATELRDTEDRFRLWLLATILYDVAHFGPVLSPATAPRADTMPIGYRRLDAPTDSAYRYLLTAR